MPPAEPARGRGPDLPRLFIAAPVPAEVGLQVGAVIRTAQADLGDDGRRVRWVQLEGLHLTLRFLGPTPPDRVPIVGAALDRAVAGIGPFHVRLAGSGAFPAPDRPRALWLGIQRGADELGVVTARLETELRAAGWAMETRPYRPHLTIARTDGVRGGRNVAAALDRAASGFDATFRTSVVTLYRSHLGRGPARYEPLHEVALA